MQEVKGPGSEDRALSSRSMIVSRQDDLDRADLEEVDSLFLGTPAITDLTPLERASCLRVLVFDGTGPIDPGPVKGLEGLVHLAMYDHGFIDLSFLGALGDLRELSVGATSEGGELLCRGLPAIAGLPALRRLELYGSAEAGALAWLSSLGRLEALTVHRAPVDPAWLATLSDLQHLGLVDTGTSDLGPIGELSGLVELCSRQNLIADVSSLEGLSSLETLLLGQNAIERIDPLASLSCLVHLDLAENRIAKLPDDLSALVALERLELQDNAIEDLAPLRVLGALSVLDVSGNRIEDLSLLAGMKSLRVLRLLRSPGLQDLGTLADVASLECVYLHDEGGPPPSALAALLTRRPGLKIH